MAFGPPDYAHQPGADLARPATPSFPVRMIDRDGVTKDATLCGFAEPPKDLRLADCYGSTVPIRYRLRSSSTLDLFVYEEVSDGT